MIGRLHIPQDAYFMRRCFELVEASLRAGDNPFGALLVKDGEIIAEGENTVRNDIAGHAEINAMREAVRKLKTANLSDCTLYTNCEPCAMCAVLIRDLGVARVVFGCASPKWGGYSRWNVLEAPMVAEHTSVGYAIPPIIVGGVLAAEATKLFDDLDWKMHRA